MSNEGKGYRGTHGGKKARLRAVEKIETAIRWMFQCEITDAFTLGMLLQLRESAQDALRRRLEELDYVSSLWVDGCPSRILLLTPAGYRFGLQLVAGTADESLPVGVYPSEVSLKCVQHDLLVQRIAILFLHKSKSHSVLFDRQIRHRKLELGRGLPNTAIKIPDVYLDDNSEGTVRRTAVEVQQNAESNLAVERKISQYAEAVARGDIYGLQYASTNENILEQVQRIANSEVRAFAYNDIQKNWYIRDSQESPVTQDFLIEHLSLVDISDLDVRLYPKLRKAK